MNLIIWLPSNNTASNYSLYATSAFVKCKISALSQKYPSLYAWHRGCIGNILEYMYTFKLPRHTTPHTIQHFACLYALHTLITQLWNEYVINFQLWKYHFRRKSLRWEMCIVVQARYVGLFRYIERYIIIVLFDTFKL